jgi:two-component system KDP operon response regulator KdpE
MSKPKILIVDDDPDLRRALRLRLRANNYDTVHAQDGYTAVVVVLDRLQNIDTLAGIPVVVLTARDPQNNEERALKGGAAAFFQKPVDNAELLDVIRASLTDTRTPGIRPS